MYENILENLQKYIDLYGDDQKTLLYKSFLNNGENKGEESVNRKNFNGHVTVSGLVLKNGKILMGWHKAFARLQQPGGHVEKQDKSLLDASIREVKEESGLDTEPVEDTPFFLEINYIKENLSKNEKQHLHYDFWFYLKLKDESQEIKNEDDGMENMEWVDIDSVTKEANEIAFRVIKKYKKLSK